LAIFEVILIYCLGLLAALIALGDALTRHIPYRLSLPLFATATILGSPWPGLAVLGVTMAVALGLRAVKRQPYGDGDAVLVGAGACLVDWRLAILSSATAGLMALALNRWRPVALAPWIIGGLALAVLVTAVR
jgi:hypothetical protein